MTSPTEPRASPLNALRVRDFRIYWLGLVAQIGGQHMFQFTLGWLAFEVTGSQAQLALIHLAAFVPQFALIREATRAFNLPCIEKEGFEADDLIATYARLAEEAGGDVTIP